MRSAAEVDPAIPPAGVRVERAGAPGLENGARARPANNAVALEERVDSLRAGTGGAAGYAAELYPTDFSPGLAGNRAIGVEGEAVVRAIERNPAHIVAPGPAGYWRRTLLGEYVWGERDEQPERAYG